MQGPRNTGEAVPDQCVPAAPHRACLGRRAGWVGTLWGGRQISRLPQTVGQAKV